MFDPKIPYMEAGKCYNYILLKTENPKVVKRFFVSSVKAHKLMNTDEVYNYSYACITWCENKVHDSLLYVWNTVGDFSHSDYYGVRNSRIEEMTNDEAAVFVKGLKDEWARKIYLTE